VKGLLPDKKALISSFLLQITETHSICPIALFWKMRFFPFPLLGGITERGATSKPFCWRFLFDY
jgi:hypothetical protein